MPIYLFDLKEDPNESTDIAEDNLDIVEGMCQRYEEYKSTMSPLDSASEIVEGNPIHFDEAWSSGWCKSEPQIVLPNHLILFVMITIAV